MHNDKLHQPWSLSPKEAIAFQNKWRHKVAIEKLSRPIRYIGGADISFNKFSNKVYAGIIVLNYKTLEEVHRSELVDETTFPYIPGLLSFRECPSLLNVWQNLRIKPDVLIMDGQGLAHPRRFGIACHFGVITDTPTIGCAKSILVGKHAVLANKKGATAELMDNKEKIGTALRSRDNVKPVFVSPGHKISFEDCYKIIMHCTSKYRIPEPTRKAHIMVNKLRKASM